MVTTDRRPPGDHARAVLRPPAHRRREGLALPLRRGRDPRGPRRRRCCSEPVAAAQRGWTTGGGPSAASRSAMTASRSRAQVSCGPGATSCSIRCTGQAGGVPKCPRPVPAAVVVGAGLEHREPVLGRGDSGRARPPSRRRPARGSWRGAARGGARGRPSRARPRPRRAGDARRCGAGRRSSRGMATTAPSTSAASSHHSHVGVASSSAASSVVSSSVAASDSDGDSSGCSDDSPATGRMGSLVGVLGRLGLGRVLGLLRAGRLRRVDLVRTSRAGELASRRGGRPGAVGPLPIAAGDQEGRHEQRHHGAGDGAPHHTPPSSSRPSDPHLSGAGARLDHPDRVTACGRTWFPGHVHG